MEGGRRDDGVAGAPPPQGWYYGCRSGGGGGSGAESDGSSGGCGSVELRLRLRTGSSPPAPAVAEQQEVLTAARRSMTIFYDGRVCAVDVTEIQAREIISMANREISAAQRQQQHGEDRHVQDGSSGQARPAAVARVRPQDLAAMVTTTGQMGLSMKRSLQQFLQKREARRAAAVAPPYARQSQAMRH